MKAMFVCDKAFESQSRGLMEHATVPVDVRVIKAGKFRRYHNTSALKQLLDVPTVAWNIRDGGRILAGFAQSMKLLKQFKPDIVFAKGGYVCLPLGYAAKILRIPVVIHDSDTRPGLTNKVLARFAAAIATGSPTENYNYPAERTVYTGVPIDDRFRPLSPTEQRAAKQAIGVIDLTKPLVVVTGGGLGAASINAGIVQAAPELIEYGVSVYHVTGKKHYAQVREVALEHPAYQVVEFVYKDMVQVLGAADVVISRGSATFLQELAALAKPTIIVPAHHLGDQNKNAVVYEQAKAAIVLTDKEVVDKTTLSTAIMTLVENQTQAAAMAERFHAFAKPDAAKDVAAMVVKTYKNTGGKRATQP